MMGNQTASYTVVAVAMGLVACAAAVALHQHAGLPAPVAATAAVAAYLLLLTVHAVRWRSGRGDFSAARIFGRRRAAAGDGRAAPQPAAAPATRTAGAAAQLPLPPRPPPGPRAAPQLPLGGGLSLQPAAAPYPDPAYRDAQYRDPQYRDSQYRDYGPALPQRADRAAPPPLPAGRAAAQAAAPAAPPAAARSTADDTPDFWSFRPAAPAQPQPPELPPFVTGRASTREAPARNEQAMPPAPPAAAQPARSPREADVEVIQDAIKRLLEEVNAAERGEERPTYAANAASVAPPPLPQHRAPAPTATGNAIDRSIDALRMTAGSMRSALGETAPAPAAAALPNTPPPLPPFVRGAAPQQRGISPADARARLMADAISAGRIDVALEPILGLEDQQTRHYEVSVRLRDADGNPLELSADGPDLRGTGLLPLFDGVRIARTAVVARRLEERGKTGSVFSAFSGESVADEHFLGELAETLHNRASLATQLVLSFTQSDVRAFSTPEWDSLADMRALGFRFALSAITDLDMDFEALAEQGFTFVKLDASVFLEGLPAPSGRLPSSDVCRHLAKHGLTLVVEHIDDDEKLARVFGFGVLLGQGQLFGGRRPVRADVVSGRASSNAA